MLVTRQQEAQELDGCHIHSGAVCYTVLELKSFVCVFILQKHTNAAQSLCDIIRLSREQIISGQDEILSSDVLLNTIEA